MEISLINALQKRKKKELKKKTQSIKQFRKNLLDFEKNCSLFN